MNNSQLKTYPGRPTIYRKLKNNILADITRSNLQPGDFYATEIELSKRFRVGRSTVRKAITEIEDEDFIIRRKRVGLLAGDRIRFIKKSASPSAKHNSLPSRMVLVLPLWDQTAGGFYSNTIIKELRQKDYKNNWIIDVRPHDDHLNHIGEDVGAVIAVDPRDHGTCARLQALAENGVKVIVIESSNINFEFAVCIRPDLYHGIKQTIKDFVRLGHKNIGIINSRLSHDLYRQLLEGYIAAHHECRLPIHYNAIIQPGELSRPEYEVDVNNITAWICSNNACLDFFARYCNMNHLKIPEDVSVIGIDDPGDKIVPSLGTTLSVMRPDYNLVGGLIHQIVNNWSEYPLGEIIKLPVINISRNSIGPVKPQ